MALAVGQHVRGDLIARGVFYRRDAVGLPVVHANEDRASAKCCQEGVSVHADDCSLTVPSVVLVDSEGAAQAGTPQRSFQPRAGLFGQPADQPHRAVGHRVAFA